MQETAAGEGARAHQAAKAAVPLLATVALTKRFGALTACDPISFDIRHGEIHALLGENGAGKSTLVKMLYGALAPDEGRILWEGRPVAIASPAEARRLGIGMVFQHFSLFEALTRGREHRARAAAARPPRARRDDPHRVARIRPAARSAMPASPISRSASGSGSRSCAACCRSRGSSSWTSRPRC